MKQNNETTHIPLEQIAHEPGLQMRAEGMDWDFMDTIKDVLLEDPEADLAPIVVFLDEDDYYYIGDGHHRRMAYQCANRQQMPCLVYTGGREAAFRHALGANADQQAKPRTRADLRKAVTEALAQWYYDDLIQCIKITKEKRKNHREIAEICKTTHVTVSRIAKELEKQAAARQRKKETGHKEPDPAQELRQLDFWDEMNRDIKPVFDGLELFLNHSRWMDEQVPAADKVEAVRAAREGLKKQLRKLEEREKALLQQEPTQASA